MSSQAQEGIETMRHRHIIATTSAALAAFAFAGCGVFAPDDSASAISVPKEAAPVVGAEEHTNGLEHTTEPTSEPGLAEGAARPEDTT